MRERLDKILDELDQRRQAILEEYLQALEVPEWNSMNSMKAIGPAERLHDLDRHITNIHLELKRLELTNG